MSGMEEHVALGPIAWSCGGEIATTTDGFEGLILVEDDGSIRVELFAPRSYEALFSRELSAVSLIEARALIAQHITDMRQEERACQVNRVAALDWCWRLASAVSAAAYLDGPDQEIAPTFSAVRPEESAAPPAGGGEHE